MLEVTRAVTPVHTVFHLTARTAHNLWQVDSREEKGEKHTSMPSTLMCEEINQTGTHKTLRFWKVDFLLFLCLSLLLLLLQLV